MSSLADMTVEQLLAAYEQRRSSERAAYAAELDARGVLHGARPQWPVTFYARWLMLQHGAQPAEDPNFDVVLDGRRVQVYGRHERDRAPLYSWIRWDPTDRLFDDYALVAVAPGYQAAEALLCDWNAMHHHVRSRRGSWRVAINSLRRSPGLELFELPDAAARRTR